MTWMLITSSTRSVSFQGSALRKAHAANDLSGARFVGVYGNDEMQNPLGLVFLTHVSG
jgi:hypothetical protein